MLQSIKQKKGKLDIAPAQNDFIYSVIAVANGKVICRTPQESFGEGQSVVQGKYKLPAGNEIFVNGKKATIGQKVDPEGDVVTYLGKIVEKTDKKIYLMLNKPRGYVATLSDEKDRRCVADLVKDVSLRVYPIGRLDYNSEGVLLFTNDGEIANRLIHPSSDVEKVYMVRIKGK
jgi:23S rRNA-/tRNA-specific pseudouridylate synthase